MQALMIIFQLPLVGDLSKDKDMYRSKNFSFLLTVLLFVLLNVEMKLHADEGNPLAVSRWQGGMISVETHWGLRVMIEPSPRVRRMVPSQAGRVVRPSETIDHYLTRLPNMAEPAWLPSAEFAQSRHAANSKQNNDPNAVHIKSLSTGNNKSHALLLAVDGVRIVYIPLDQFVAGNKVSPAKLSKVDLLILATPDSSHLQQPEVISLVRGIQPRKVLLDLANKTKLSDTEQWATSIGGNKKINNVNHNTLALSQSTVLTQADEKQRSTEVVLLGEKPWKMPAELAGLFKEMEKSSSDSQRVFAKLSAKQLNFRPANGTHTPRWNTEHMMGRQLLFFSQIYHAQDPTIPVMDLNPKQMPPDYKAAHPKWDGPEEARQTQRVSEFTRRFAYLLADIDLDKKAPGSRWKLRALLKQMDHHYSEHTANTIKKFDLPGWPKE